MGKEDDLLISIEPPLILSSNAKESLNVAKQKAFENDENEDISNLDVLQRAWMDKQKSVKPAELPLSSRLVKLWSERGDFSKFRASTLLRKDGELEKEEEEKVGISIEEDLGAILTDLENDEGKEKEDGQNDKDTHEEEADKAKSGPEIMSIEDMVQVRRNMLDKLSVAQNSLYFSHALVSLLINSTKLGNDQQHSSTGRAGSATNSAKLGFDTLGGAGSTSRSITGAAQTMGSAAALETELGIEPFVFGASQIEAFRRDLERSGEYEEEADERAEVEEEEEDLEDISKERRKIVRLDNKVLDEEVEDHAKELVERIECKKEGILSAIEILRKGAKTIDPENEGAGREKVRWQALMLARRAGWSLTPDKPIRGTAAKKAELLQDFGALKKDEPARDAWIGYAVPENSSRYSRQALAYLSHSSTEGDSPADALLFASRPGKRLRIEILIGKESWTSEGEEDEDDEKTLDGTLRQAQSELVDEELFDSIVAECRILSIAGLCNVTIDDEDQVTIDLNAFTKLRFLRQEKKESPSQDDDDVDKRTVHSSPIIQAILSILRLSLFRRYRQRAGVGMTTKGSDQMENNEEVKAPLLQPLLGLIHYASFVAHLRVKLLVLAKLNDEKVQVEMDAFERIGDFRSWLKVFLQRTDGMGDMTAIRKLGGSATILYDEKPFAYISFHYPSQTSLALPLKKLPDGSGTGVHLPSVDLTSLDGILTRELERIGSIV